MKNWNSKDKKYYDIKGDEVRDRAKEVAKLYSLGKSIKELASKYELSESRIREYLKK
jgi:Mor family transcriptional regulator